MDPPSRAGRPPGSTTILAENVSCPRPEIDCPTALGRQTDPAESRCGSARLAWQSSAVFQFAFESPRGRRERMHNPEVDGCSVLLVFPGKGPDVAFDDQLAAPTLAASGGHGVAAVGVVFGVVGEHDQVLRFYVHELVADKKASAAPAIVPQSAGFLRRLAEAGIELGFDLPGSLVGQNLLDAGGRFSRGARAQYDPGEKPEHSPSLNRNPEFSPEACGIIARIEGSMSFALILGI